MKGRLDEVKETIRDPQHIARDAQFTDRQVYYRPRDSGPSYMKVIVRLKQDSPAEVLTAFPSDSGKKGETILWTKSGAS